MGMPRNFADPGKRLVAYLIDAFILAVSTGIISTIAIVPMVMGLAASSTFDDPEKGIALALAGTGLFLLVFVGIMISIFLYFVLQESGKHQATLGKRAMKLYVSDMEGNRLTFGKATVRFVGRIVNSFTMLVGYAMCLFTEYKQGLHDMIAGTLVLDGLGDHDGSEELEEY